MAGILCSVTTPSLITVNTGPTTLLQVEAPANQRVVITKIQVTFAGSNTCTLQLMTQTTAGTMTGATAYSRNGATETLQSVWQHSATAEPTSGNVYETFADDNPFYFEWIPEGGIHVVGGTRFGIVATTSASTGVRATIEFEE